MHPETPSLHITVHAGQRIAQRRISAAAIDVVLTYGRRAFVRGAQIRAIGHREVARYRAKGIDLSAYEGIQVLLDPAGATVITAYRNRDFRALKPSF